MRTVKPNTFRLLLLACMMSCLVMVSCKKKKDDEVTPTPDTETPTFRGTKIDYNVLTATTNYNNSYFVNSSGDTTVDRTEGHNRLKIIRAMDAYAKTSANAGTAMLSASVFANMFENSNSPFTGTYTPLNTAAEQVRDVTATSKPTSVRDQVIDEFAFYFADIATASLDVNNTASAGNAGKLSVTAPSTSKYLVDEKGIEVGQVIAKSLIGAFQLDYISNVLLNTGLNADNTKEVTGKKYTALEHNWDVAYGILSLNQIYAGAATTTSNGGESFLGSYVWEYNKDGYPKLHMAFLKGRAAIVNNDMTVVKEQAAIIRGILERAIANAAVGYLGKWTTGADDAVRAHAIGEGLGFIYSLRFCQVNGADETFSAGLITNLGLYTGDGFWDLTQPKVTAASTAIKTKFGI